VDAGQPGEPTPGQTLLGAAAPPAQGDVHRVLLSFDTCAIPPSVLRRAEDSRAVPQLFQVLVQQDQACAGGALFK